MTRRLYGCLWSAKDLGRGVLECLLTSSLRRDIVGDRVAEVEVGVDARSEDVEWCSGDEARVARGEGVVETTRTGDKVL
jgi:hypothetical protein